MEWKLQGRWSWKLSWTWTGKGNSHNLACAAESLASCIHYEHIISAHTHTTSSLGPREVYLDPRVLARSPLDTGGSGFLQHWVCHIITDHVVRLHQLLVAEERVVTELEDDLEPLYNPQGW